MSGTDDMQTLATSSVCPFDPLTGPELERAARLARDAIAADGRLRLIDISAREPDKAQLRSWRPGLRVARDARVVALDRSGATHELVVSLDRDEVTHATRHTDVQPAITPGEYAECEQLVRVDPAFRAALRHRGVTDTDLVTVEAWGIGTHARTDERNRRLAWTPCWVRDDPDDNPYAHPIDGLFAIVDLVEMAVIRIEDHGATAVPRGSGRYRAEQLNHPERGDLRPLDIVQPEGPSFTVDGWQVCWQRWSLRLGFTAREGLVLHQITYNDQGQERSILHRASFSELTVPYGDPGPNGYRKAAFDVGEYGLGALTNSLKLGCDCLGEVYYFDVDLSDEDGRAYTIEQAICMHEEDDGILWKHYDTASGHVEVRRSRRLVISFIVTVANYEYAFYWYFYQDGRIEAEVKATGIVITQGLSSEADRCYGTVVAPGLLAPHHQHFICVRLDFDIDGECNTVYEVNTEAVPRGDANPHGNAFRVVRTPLTHELQARRLIDPLQARYWTIVNEQVTNAMGAPVGYKLLPGENVVPFAAPDSDVMRRGGFMGAHVWVTRNDPAQRFASGEYPNQHAGGDGLPAYQAGDRSLRREDVVVWYTFGLHHIVRPEDWPVMPVDCIGFTLKPVGFFDRNPALDVPVGQDACHCNHNLPRADANHDGQDCTMTTRFSTRENARRR